MDVNGNDNQPEWGWCNAPDCKNAASPIWLSGDYPDDPDLLLCDRHIGAEIARLRKTLEAAYHGLMSYACGNSATALAEEMAAEITRALAELQTQDATKVRSA
jgi:hypothetical protein